MENERSQIKRSLKVSIFVIRISSLLPVCRYQRIKRSLKDWNRESVVATALWAVNRCNESRITHQTSLIEIQVARSGDINVVVPPVPIPNTEVKRCSPDGSTATGRARVGRRQNKNPGELYHRGFCFRRRFLEHGRRPKRIERLGTARWTVKPARVAGERTGVRESIGRRQNKNPGELYHRGFCFRRRLLEHGAPERRLAV